MKENMAYKGLANQGATCYMNSLLQSLYMTPEFRKKIYSWQFDEKKHGDKSDSIPFQLQLLFASLQSGKENTPDTKGLTKSFGWDLKESFQQHDVQEFCRVLFDAIEKSVQGTPEENMINTLYQGETTDYVKCNKCLYQSERSDTFLDLSLTVKNPFDNIYNDSLEKCLYNYVKVEELKEDNQYFCSKCESKQDAIKGIKFTKLPYILVTQLKRFDLDYETLQRLKLNDKVTFPTILNANKFLGDIKNTEFEDPVPVINNPNFAETNTLSSSKLYKDEDFAIEVDGLDNKDLKVLASSSHESIFDDFEKKSMKADKFVRAKIIERETEERKANQMKEIELYRQDGEYVYELFSIMIHSGSAMGGHYFAYLKSFEDSKWRNFNDSSVKEIEDKEILKVFGGKETHGWDSSYSTNAYLLMYRKISNENIIKVEESEIPFIIKEELENKKPGVSDYWDYQNLITFKIYYKKKDLTIRVKKENTFLYLKQEAIKKFEVNDFEEKNIRLRAYLQYYDILQDIYDEQKTIDELNFFNYKILALETKLDDEEWSDYDPNDMIIRVNLWNDSLLLSNSILEEKTDNPFKIAVKKQSTILDMMKAFEEKFEIPIDKQRIFKKCYIGISTYCENVNNQYNLQKVLQNTGIYDGSVVYLEEADEDHIKSKWQSLFDQESKRCIIKFNNPTHKLTENRFIEFNCSVSLDYDSTLGTLRDLISKKIGIPSDQFIMKRAGNTALEFKDMQAKLMQANLNNYSIIAIELGSPLNPNEHRLLFSLGYMNKLPEKDALCYTFYDLFDMPINDRTLISDLKSLIIAKSNLFYPTLNLAPQKVRLRERASDRVSKILIETEYLTSYILYDRKQVCVEVLDEEDTKEYSSSDLIILAKKWSPSTWEISECKEIIIKKYSSVYNLGEIFSKIFNIPVIIT
jgi:ubiquitin carboxyl-terminal hydrolase 47